MSENIYSITDIEKPDMSTEPTTGQKVGPRKDPAYTSSRWEPIFSDGAIIEYVCSNCHKNVFYRDWNATYCPHCGAPIFNFPRNKLTGTQGRIGDDNKFLEGLRHEAGRANGAETIRKASNRRRASSGAKRRIEPPEAAEPR